MGHDDVGVLSAKLENISGNLDEIKKDVKFLREEGLPRRVGKLEKWRESMSSRFWWFACSVVVVTLGSVVTAVISLVEAAP